MKLRHRDNRFIPTACALLIGFTATSAFPGTATGLNPSAEEDGEGRYQEFGDTGGFWNIFTPGQQGTMTPEELSANLANPAEGPAHAFDQIDMYNKLAHVDPSTLTDESLSTYFKDASFGVPEDKIERVYHPGDNEDVTVVRDTTAGVPHIFGTTRYATMFAQGYTSAEDRILMMDVLRHVGRGTLSELVGADLGKSSDEGTIGKSPYKQDDFEKQVDAFSELGEEGQAVKADMDAYADGVNQFIAEAAADPTKLPAEYGLLGITPTEWSPADTVAIASNIGGIFGAGGGSELDFACALGQDGAVPTRTQLADINVPNDPEGPATSTKPAPYGPEGPVDPAANPAIDCSTLKNITPKGVKATGGLGSGDWLHQILAGLTKNKAMSNAILIAGSKTASKKPIAVFGPQVGYNSPGLMIEKDVHGPGIDARGVAFVGADMYVQLGRGVDYAWSATSSSADNVDIVILELCDPEGAPVTTESMGYLMNETCKPIESFDHTEVLKGDDPSNPSIRWNVQRSEDYGPITHRGTLRDGRPIAIATHRSTYGAELSSAIGFKRLNDPEYMKGGYESFRTATGEGIDFTFNWFYIDDSTIGYQHSCKCPIRADGVDTVLPAMANGKFDWDGYLKYTQQPADSNPEQGYIVSWNNRSAKEFGAADNAFWGPVHRSLALSDRVEAALEGPDPLTKADVVRIMEDAATVDVNGATMLPLLLQVLGDTPPEGIDPRTLDMKERLEIWESEGSHRRALADPTVYDNEVAPAIMDAWWDVLRSDVYDPAMGGLINTAKIPTSDTPRNHGGSSYFDAALLSLIDKDMRTVLGKKVALPLSQTYCGTDLATCSTTLWNSLAATAKLMESPRPENPTTDLEKIEATNHFGTPDVASWKRTLADDEIQFQGLVSGAVPMTFQNRPTFQQVVELASSSRERSTPPPSSQPKSQDDTSSSSDKDDDSIPAWQLALGAVLAVLVLGSGVMSARKLRKRTK